MFKTIQKLLKGDGGHTAGTLKAALTEIDLPRLEDNLNAANAERQRLLLDGDDAAILAAERKIEAARIALDRGRAATEEISLRIAQAERDEAEAVFQAERAAIDAKANEAAALLVKVYPRASAEIIAALDALAEAEAAVGQFNSRCSREDRHEDRLDPVENRAWKETDWRRQGQYGVHASTSLRPTASTAGYGFGQRNYTR